ncbi:hypothetical protein OIU78_013228 [Salix suchowensis]|nr:hypothetical protein OIU78_013228 [Salix suchowensis]
MVLKGTAARAAGLGLISVAAASLILLLVGKNPSNNITTAEYKGPSLSYYINKFKPGEIIQAAVPSQTEPPSSIQADSSMPEIPEIQVQSAPDISEVPVQSRFRTRALNFKCEQCFLGKLNWLRFFNSRNSFFSSILLMYTRKNMKRLLTRRYI